MNTATFYPTDPQSDFVYLDEYESKQPFNVAIGVFDGVHRGHQALLREVRVGSEDRIPATLTFDPHPAAVFSPGRMPEMLGTLTARARLLRQQGANDVIVARFDRAFAAMTPADFIERVLVQRLQAAKVVVGEDFRFGCDRTGNVAILREAGSRYGFEVCAIPPVFVNGIPARSTAIRQMLAGGQVEEAARLLGRPYRLTGEVVHGRKLGRTLGFPTANLATSGGVLVPAAGVYAGYANLLNGETWRTAISIGTNPTVTPGSPVRTVEAFLMDGFSNDLYGQEIALDFVTFLRPTLKFESLDALIQQMHRDVASILLPNKLEG